MKEKYQKYIAWGLTAFCVIASSILLFFLLYKLNAIKAAVKGFMQILEPFLVGALIAYLLAPIYNALLRNLEPVFRKKLKQKLSHGFAVGISLFVSIMLALLVVVGLFALVVPQFINSIVGIINSLDTYSNNVVHWLNTALAGHPDVAAQVESTFQSISDSFMDWVNNKLAPNAEALLKSISNLSTVLSGVVSGVKVVVRVIKDFIIGQIVAAYLLVSKRHMIGQVKKITYGLLPRKSANYLVAEFRYISDVFGGFIRGKLMDSLIIGVICFVGCTILRIPYALVVSVIVGVTNIIPFFGPFIGAIPSALLILLDSPLKCVYFVIFVLALQQFDGNILGPKILGNTTGLSSFWVLFSIMLFGGLFGFVGMIIAVPLFAVIYSLISTYINHRLKKRELTQVTKEYELLEQIDVGSGKFVHMQDPEIKQ